MYQQLVQPSPRRMSMSVSAPTHLTKPPESAAELPALSPSTFALGDSFGDVARLRDDGRIDIDFDTKLARTLSVLYQPHHESRPSSPPPTYSEAPKYIETRDQAKSWVVKLNIVVQVVGSRGDVQPFIALGTELRKFGHRVRIATHDVFEKFVRDSGLEFYPIGGDPAELMAYMVKNPDLIPSMKSLAAGEIQRKRYMVKEMLEGCWWSCLRPDTMTNEPFVAGAIIANPPSFAHVHCAQALGIPVHLMFTMPWSNTTAFPHPLANLKNEGDNPGLANYLSYSVVEWLTWQGLGDVINKWRKSLDLEDVDMFDGSMLAQTLKIPFTYCWSPALVPKPSDWPSHIDVCGFFFRESPRYEPPVELVQFLTAGPPPVYIGFGSIVLEDPAKMISMILDAVRNLRVRAIISKGWSDLAGSQSDDVYYIGDCPHEWLFQHVAAVVHHGGAGTTACGLRNSKPTVVVPFFGDQPFWGRMVANAGAGPSPIPHEELTAAKIADAVRYCLSPEAAAAAARLAEQMKSEMGVQAAVQSFHRHLPLERLQCDLLPDQPAVWSYTKGKRQIKLSKIVAESVLSKTSSEYKNMKIYRTNPFTMETSRWDPVSGGASAVMSTAVDLTGSITGIVGKPVEEYRAERQRRKRETQRASAGGSHGHGGQAEQTKSRTGEPALDHRDSMSLPRDDSSSATKGEKNEQPSLAAKMAGASAKSIGSFTPKALKGMVVDIPLAITEGLRAVPSHYGDKGRNHGPVTDIKSDATVAGKTFAWGFVDGLSDIVVQPYKGARKEGALGAVKGFGKGVVSLTAKSGAGMFGLLAYPSAGVAKSLRSAVYSKTRKTIAQERHREGQWLIKTGAAAELDLKAATATFERLLDNK